MPERTARKMDLPTLPMNLVFLFVWFVLFVVKLLGFCFYLS